MSAGVDNTEFERIVHSTVMDVAVEAALNAITVAVPFLGFPVIKQVFFFVAKKLIDAVYVEIARGIAFQVIGMNVEKENAEYKEAVTALKNKIDFPTSTQKDEANAEIEKARLEFEEKLRILIRFPVKPRA